MAYSVTIYIADAGTPLNNENGTPKMQTVTVVGPDGNPITTEVQVTSTAGHMYYGLTDSVTGTTNYYGFQSTNGSPKGALNYSGIIR